MRFTSEEQLRDDTVMEIAKRMAVAARTAPKGKGIDNIVISVLDRKGIRDISDFMKKMVEEKEAAPFFGRDAENILSASALLLVGTRIEPLNLKPCGLCGFGDCDGKRQHPDTPCAFNTGDLGIAIGSAVSIAADNRLDNRVMYTVGIAALRKKVFSDDVKIVYGIPVSAGPKNPFFDRK